MHPVAIIRGRVAAAARASERMCNLDRSSCLLPPIGDTTRGDIVDQVKREGARDRIPSGGS
jgi:hypothetical protein